MEEISFDHETLRLEYPFSARPDGEVQVENEMRVHI